MVNLAFPSGDAEAVVAAVYSVSFLLDHVRSLSEQSCVRGDTVATCSRLVTSFFPGTACRVCGAAAEGVVYNDLSGSCVPAYMRRSCNSP